MLPYLQMLCQYVRLTSVDIGVGKEPVVRPKELVKAVQRFAFAVVCEGHVSDYEILNLDMLHNCVHSLKSLGAVYYEVSQLDPYLYRLANADVPHTTPEIEQAMQNCSKFFFSCFMTSTSKVVVLGKVLLFPYHLMIP